MKKLIIVLLTIGILLLAGCLVVPEVPEVPVEPVETPIVCEGGFYEAHYDIWSFTGCPGDDQVKGTYWFNADGRMFLISEETPFDPDSATELQDTFGVCPVSYIEEIFK